MIIIYTALGLGLLLYVVKAQLRSCCQFVNSQVKFFIFSKIFCRLHNNIVFEIKSAMIGIV